MKLTKFLDDFYTHSGNASTVSRQLTFAGIAIIWLFKTDTNASPYNLPVDLLFPIFTFVIALAFDLLQYVVAAIIWSLFYRYHEKKHGITEDPELGAPSWMNKPVYFFFYTKIIACMSGYILLANFIFNKVSFS